MFTTERSQMTVFFFTDVRLCGEYSGYALRYSKDNSIAIHADENELVLLKSSALDFLTISYYDSNVVDYEKNTMAIGNTELNPYLKANPWGRTINPLGLYDCFLNYWDRYGRPLVIAENGFGQVEKLDSEHELHNDYRIGYIKGHIRALQKTVQHSVNVFTYYAWSPIDMVSSETSEMKRRYDSIYSDQGDTRHGTQKRYPKDSYWWYRNVIATNGNMF